MILNRMLRDRTFGRKHASAVKPRFYQFAFVFAEGIRVVLRGVCDIIMYRLRGGVGGFIVAIG